MPSLRDTCDALLRLGRRGKELVGWPMSLLHAPGRESTVDPLACAVFLTLAFVLAGAGQTLWLRSAISRRVAFPLDCRLTYRGKRLFGANKTLRGLVVMLPAAAAAFSLLRLVALQDPSIGPRLWPLPSPLYALLGLWAGVGFMAGELPNSFLKRQFGIPPGAAPEARLPRVLCFLADRLDSITGMLAAVSIAVPTPWLTWLYLMLFGPIVHWSFSVILYWCGVKGRPA